MPEKRLAAKANMDIWVGKIARGGSRNMIGCRTVLQKTWKQIRRNEREILGWNPLGDKRELSWKYAESVMENESRKGKEGVANDRKYLEV